MVTGKSAPTPPVKERLSLSLAASLEKSAALKGLQLNCFLKKGQRSSHEQGRTDGGRAEADHFMQRDTCQSSGKDNHSRVIGDFNGADIFPR